MEFKWHPSEKPPSIEPHSKAKLEVLRKYLGAYFDRLNTNPAREVFKLDLIDGFAGGGVFSEGDTVIPGTPLIMLEEAERATERLNKTRVKKKLNVDCKFYFVEKNEAHFDCLQKALKEYGYNLRKNKIELIHNSFDKELERIIASTQRRQPRAGRAIFLLDQTGYTHVELENVSQIFQRLPNSEVILTFAADALINYLKGTPQNFKAAAKIHLNESQVKRLIQEKSKGGRALVQRTLRAHIREITGARFDTPFFIQPEKSRRALWFIHLSMHPTARNVMLQQHWDAQNIFEHYGPGDFGMLGWDALKDPDGPALFRFGDLDQQQMRKGLLESVPRKLFGLISERSVSIETLQHMLANETAARFSDMDEIIVKLMQEKEFDILNKEGKIRSRSIRRLSQTDRVSLPRRPMLPGISRRK